MKNQNRVTDRLRTGSIVPAGSRFSAAGRDPSYRGGGGGSFSFENLRFTLPYSVDFSALPDGGMPIYLSGSTWRVYSGKAINTPSVGSEMILNGHFNSEDNWSRGTGWTINDHVASVSTAGTFALSQNAAILASVWYQIGYNVTAYTSGSITLLVGSDGAFTKDRSATGAYIETIRRVSSGNGVLYIYSNGGAVASIDDVTIKPVTIGSLFAFLPETQSDVTVKSACNCTGFSPAGVALSWDNSRLNGVIGYVTGNNRVRLEKCVAGVWSTLIDGVATYGAGKVVKVVKSGNSYSLYYGVAGSEIQVGATQTVSDAGIVNNTVHGCFASAGAQLQSFFAIP